MKQILFVSLLFLLLLALVLFSVWYMVQSAEQLSNLLPAIERAVQAQDWTTAQQEYEKCKAEFEQIRKKWEVLINHDDMRDIEIALIDVGSAIAAEDRNEALKEIHELLFFLMHIPDTERVDVGNIL